jgi:hypothetical protein
MDVRGLAVDGSPEVLHAGLSAVHFSLVPGNIKKGRKTRARGEEETYITAVLSTPNVAVGVKRESDLIPEAPAKLVPLGIVLPTISGSSVSIKDPNGGTHVGSIHIKVGVAANRHNDQVRLVRHNVNGPGKVYTSAHVLDDGLLVSESLGSGIVVPGPDVCLRASIQLLAVRAQTKAMAEADVLTEQLAAGNAAVGTEGEDADSLSVAEDKEIARAIEGEGAWLLEVALDLGDLPVGVDLEGESVGGDPGAAGWEGDWGDPCGVVLRMD